MAPSDDRAGSAARLETRRRRPAYGEAEERGAPDVIAEADDDDDDEATAGMVTASVRIDMKWRGNTDQSKSRVACREAEEFKAV